MRGRVSNELDVSLPADKVWAVYRSHELPRLIVELQPGVFEKLDVVKGDGGVGTVLHIVLVLGNPRPTNWEEKFLKVDDETRTKVIRQIKGGYLDLGFTLYEVIFEVIEKDATSCTIRSSVAFELDEKFEANASLITAASFWGMAKAIANYALKKSASDC